MRIRKLTKEEEELLRELYPVNTTEYVAEKLGITTKQCYRKAYAMGVYKDPEWNAKHLKMLGSNSIVHLRKYQFKKGHIPENKGKKVPEEIKDKIRHTFFKKGNLPCNTLYDGAETIRTEKGRRKYVYVRVSLAKWVPKHILLWEQAHGAIPSGYNVVFKDGNSLNAVLENLELISNKELMERNTLHRYPKEIKDLIQMKGVLSRKIKEVERKNGNRVRQTK